MKTRTRLLIAKILSLIIIFWLCLIAGVVFLAGMAIGAEITIKTFSQFSWTWEFAGKAGMNIFTWTMLIYFGGMEIRKLYDTIVEIIKS